MELNLQRTSADQPPRASRRWPAGPRSTLQAAAEWRYVIAITAVTLLVALAGGSPHL